MIYINNTYTLIGVSDVWRNDFITTLVNNIIIFTIVDTWGPVIRKFASEPHTKQRDLKCKRERV